MSDLIPKMIGDIIEDKIYNTLVKVRDAEVLINPAINFNIRKEVFIPLDINELPCVNIIFVKEETTKEAARTEQAIDLYYDIDLYASVFDEDAVAADTRSAKALFYLASQVKTAISKLSETDFDFSPGIISKRPFPVFERKPNLKISEQGERIISAGKISLIIGTSFSAVDIISLPLEIITVNTNYITYQKNY
jgi:hypothetical protein